MKSQFYTKEDMEEVYFAGRELAKILNTCHLSAEHRAQAKAADSALNNAMIAVSERAERRNRCNFSMAWGTAIIIAASPLIVFIGQVIYFGLTKLFN